MAWELDHLPDLRSQDIQSHVLTTAILCRRIDDRLGGALKNLSIRERIGTNHQLSFIRLINILVHYSRFVPDLFVNSSNNSTGPDHFTVQVHSEPKNNDPKDRRLTFRLSDYFVIVKRVVTDDMFVLSRLLAASINRLGDASVTAGELGVDCLNEIVSSVDDVIYLSRKVRESCGVSLRTVAVGTMFEVRFRDTHGNKDYMPTDWFSGYSQFIDGYGTSWTYSPFTPTRMHGGEYCIEIQTQDRDPDDNFALIALPFGMLHDVFTAIRQLPRMS